MGSLKNLGQEDVQLNVYDPIEKKIIATYNTCREASDKLGISQSAVRAAAVHKTRRYSRILDKEIAIRYSPRNK